MLQPDDLEPMLGIGRLTDALEAFATFFDIDRDLVAAAAERCPGPDELDPDAGEKSSPR